MSRLSLAFFIILAILTVLCAVRIEIQSKRTCEFYRGVAEDLYHSARWSIELSAEAILRAQAAHEYTSWWARIVAQSLRDEGLTALDHVLARDLAWGEPIKENRKKCWQGVDIGGRYRLYSGTEVRHGR